MTKIMLIEDDQSLIHELKIHLQHIYCDVILVADSGETAVTFLKKASKGEVELPDVIFMDIALNLGTAFMNATETAKEIRMGWHIPIIFIVGHQDEEFIYNVKLDFPFGYVLTPISTRELKVTIDIAIYTAKIERERIKAQNDLIKSEERYKALVDNLVSGVAIYEVVGDGEDFIFVDINKAGEEIENQRREEIIGKSIFAVKPGVYESGLIDTFKRVLKTGEPHHQPITLYKDDKVSRYYDNYVYKLSTGEIVTLFKDETLKKQTEENMKQLTSQLNHAQKMEAIGIMAGGIAHDFNNILFPIIGCTEMLLENSDEGSIQKEFLDQILKAGQRAKELVRQILTFSRQEHQEMMPLAVQPIVKEIIKLSRALIPSTIKIDYQIDKNCGMIMADPTNIHQVLMNLITNSFHAMEDTGGTLTIKVYNTQKSIAEKLEDTTLYADKNRVLNKGDKIFNVNDIPPTLSTELSSIKYLCIEVSDTGVGIDEKTMDRIFEPYFTTKEQGKGTGLGLSVVHGIVKGCKGNITVTSTPGKGTSFKIYIPEIERENSDITVNTLHFEKYTGNETIMVVDDEVVVTNMLARILERAGYKVVKYTKSLEALESFKEKPDMYDLVITDLTMPELTGENLCSSLKAIKPNIPVILCTGFSRKAEEFKEDYGINKVLMKPIVSHELLKSLRELLGQAQ